MKTIRVGGMSHKLPENGVRRIELHAAFVFGTGGCAAMKWNKGLEQPQYDKVL